MAQVPEAGPQTVAPQGIQPLEHIAANEAAFGQPIAQGLINLAGSVDKASDMLTQRAEQQQALTNKANVDTASIASDTAQNKIFEDFQANAKGANATPAAYSDYVAQLSAARQAERAGITSPMAQSMYDAATRRTQFAFEAEGSRHVAAEQQKWFTTSTTNKMQTAADLYSAHPENADLETAMLGTLKTQARALALHNGEDTPDTPNADGTVTPGAHDNSDLMVKKMLGQTYAEVAKTLAITSPTGAMEYLKAREELMDPKSYSLATAQLKPALMANDAAQIADVATTMAVGGSHAPAAAANPASYFSALAGGNVTITSGARSPEHNADVGGVPTSEHIPGQGTAYDMTPPPGMSTAQLAAKLRAAIPDAHQILDEGDHVHVGWKAGANGSVTANAGGAMTSMQLEGRAQTALAQADAFADAKYPGNDAFKQMVEAKTMANLNRQVSAAKDVETAGYSDLALSVIHGDIQDLPTLLAQPGALDKFNALPPNMVTALEADLKRNGNELTPPRIANATAAAGLYANRANAPQAFLDHDFAADDLRTTDRLAILKEQSAFRANPMSGAGSVDKVFNQITQSPEFKSTVQALAIPTRITKANPENKDYNHLLGAVSAELDAWRTANPDKQPKAADVSGMIARATAMTGTYRPTFLGIATGASRPQTELDHTPDAMRAFDVPDKARAAAITYLTAHGLPPNEKNIAKLVHGAGIQ